MAEDAAGLLRYLSWNEQAFQQQQKFDFNFHFLLVCSFPFTLSQRLKSTILHNLQKDTIHKNHTAVSRNIAWSRGRYQFHGGSLYKKISASSSSLSPPSDRPPQNLWLDNQHADPITDPLRQEWHLISHVIFVSFRLPRLVGSYSHRERSTSIAPPSDQ